MKGILRTAVSVMVSAAMILQTAPMLAAESDEYKLNQTFNNLATNAVAIDGLTISGGKVVVADDGSSNKAILLKDGTSETSVVGEGVNTVGRNVVFSVDVKGDGRPTNLTIAAAAAVDATSANDCRFFIIENNAVKTPDGKRIGSVNPNGFTTLSVVVKKAKVCDYYINYKKALSDWNLDKTSVGRFLAIRQPAGFAAYVDNIRAYYGRKVDENMAKAAYSDTRVDIIGQDDYAGDYTFFDNRFCYTSGDPKYTNFTAVPKTNEIKLTRLENYQSQDRTDYMYLKRLSSVDDCFFDINVAVESFTHKPDMTYKYFKFEGDFMSNEPQETQLPMIRDNKTTTSQVNAVPCYITEEGSLKFLNGKVISNAVKPGQWFHLLIAINLEDHTFDAYLDGKAVVTGGALPETLKQINLLRVCLNYGTGKIGDLYVDKFNFTGLEKPIVNGVETRTRVFPTDDTVEAFLADKTAMHAYGNTLFKNGEKTELATDGIYDKHTEQYYVTADALSKAFDMNLADNGGEISGDVKIAADGTVTKQDGTTLTLDPKPKVEDGKMYVPVLQFAADVAGKHTWHFKTGLYLFADYEMNIDTSGWEYQSMRVNSQTTEWNDIDYLNNYMQYIRPSAETLKQTYIERTGDTTFTQHPRLLLDKDDFDVMRRHYIDKDDEMYNKIAEQMVKKADTYVGADVVHYTWDDMMRILSATAAQLINRFLYMGYAYQLTGDQKYVDQAYKQFEECATYPDFNTSHIIDTGDICFALAIGFDWFYNGFTPEQRAFAKTVVRDKGLATLGSGLYGRLTSTSSGTNKWGSFKWMSNYNAIVNGGVVSAALATLEYDTDEAFTYIQDSVRSLEYPMQMFTPDGGWNESPSYWSYAMRYVMTAGAALEKSFGSSFNLMDGQGMDNTLNFIISCLGKTAANNFGDSGDITAYSFNNFFYLGKRYNNPIATLMRRTDIDNGAAPDYYDAIFYDFDATSMGDEVYDALPNMLRTNGTEIVSFRDSYKRSEAQTYFSTHFGTTSGYHQHYDCGTFVLDLLGERWAYDLGADNYNLQNELKYPEYAIYRKRSEGHNVLVLNPQNYSKSVEMKLNQFAPIIDAQGNEYGGFVYADLDDVYNESSKMTEGYYIDDNMNSVTYRNEFTLDADTDCMWSLNTKAEIDIDGDTVYLSKNGKSVRIDFIYTGTGAKWSDGGNPKPLPTSPQVPEQNANTDYRKLVLNYKAAAGDNKLIIKISPMGMKIKPIADVTFADWKLPEQSQTVADFNTDFTVKYNGTPVAGSLPVYDGVMPQLDITTADPRAIVEVAYAANADEKTRIKVWDPDRTQFQMAVVSYFIASGANMMQFNQLPAVDVSVSSQPEPENKRENIIDNDLTTRWTGMALGEYAVIDLGDVYSIDGVAAAFWKGDQRNYWFDIYVSADGQNWTPAIMNGESSGDTTQLEAYAFDSAISGRYVKIVGHGNSVSSDSRVNINLLEMRALQNKF